MPNIHYPVRVEGNARSDTTFVTIYDASDRAIAGGLTREDAEEIVRAMNLYGDPKPKHKSTKVQVEEALRRSDLSGQLAGREDIQYTPADALPGGDHILRLGAAKRLRK